MSQPRDERQDALFQPPLDKIINLRHPLVRLAREIDWDFLAGRLGSVCRVGPGQPPLPTRLVAGLFILTRVAWNWVALCGNSSESRWLSAWR